MAIEGLNTNEVTPYPLWNTPLPASQQKPKAGFSAYDDRAEVLPKNRIAEKNFSDIVMGTKAGEKTESEYSFWDFADIINPLQHIPVISSVYRYLTGDEIKGSSRVLGGGLYGGPIGMLVGGVNSAIAQVEGNDIGGTVMAAMFGKPEQDIKSGKTTADIETAEVLAEKQAEPIKISRFDSETLDVAEDNILKSNNTPVSSDALTITEDSGIKSSRWAMTPAPENPIPEKRIVLAQNDTADTGNSQWQAFYNHQQYLQKQNIEEKQNSLADDGYEMQLTLEAERQAIAEQNKLRTERENINKARIDSINRLKEISQQKEFERAESLKPPPETDKYGLRPSAGMYGTGN